jgi:CBS domain-containing protein
MNILFFLTPKSKVAFVLEDFTLRQVAEKLTFHHYTAIPILSKDGRYLGTIAEGDLLRYIKDHDQLNYQAAENTPISDVPIDRVVPPIRSDCRMEDLYHQALNQNFVPVLDDQGVFIGIITRKSILEYFFSSGKTDV